MRLSDMQDGLLWEMAVHVEGRMLGEIVKEEYDQHENLKEIADLNCHRCRKERKWEDCPRAKDCPSGPAWIQRQAERD